jgi:hypothetical protein
MSRSAAYDHFCLADTHSFLNLYHTGQLMQHHLLLLKDHVSTNKLERLSLASFFGLPYHLWVRVVAYPTSQATASLSNIRVS